MSQPYSKINVVKPIVSPQVCTISKRHDPNFAPSSPLYLESSLSFCILRLIIAHSADPISHHSPCLSDAIIHQSNQGTSLIFILDPFQCDSSPPPYTQIVDRLLPISFNLLVSYSSVLSVSRVPKIHKCRFGSPLFLPIFSYPCRQVPFPLLVFVPTFRL